MCWPFTQDLPMVRIWRCQYFHHGLVLCQKLCINLESIRCFHVFHEKAACFFNFKKGIHSTPGASITSRDIRGGVTWGSYRGTDPKLWGFFGEPKRCENHHRHHPFFRTRISSWWFPNMFYFHPENWGRFFEFDSYFSNGLKPPTRPCFFSDQDFLVNFLWPTKLCNWNVHFADQMYVGFPGAVGNDLGWCA